MKPFLNLLFLDDYPLIDQLRLEQAILSLKKENYVIFHTHPQQAVVMGISGKPDELVYQDKLLTHNIPLIKRYSGGGCVYIDPGCVMLSFIFNKQDAHNITTPAAIMSWAFEHLQFLKNHCAFSFKENDWAIENKKVAGNAQYIKKERFCHHLSLLWKANYQAYAQFLKHPPKEPEYRKKRTHQDFLCELGTFLTDQASFKMEFVKELNMRYEIKQVDIKQESAILKEVFRDSNQEIKR